LAADFDMPYKKAVSRSSVLLLPGKLSALLYAFFHKLFPEIFSVIHFLRLQNSDAEVCVLFLSASHRTTSEPTDFHWTS
jgi:hypothetical protein